MLKGWQPRPAPQYSRLRRTRCSAIPTGSTSSAKEDQEPPFTELKKPPCLLGAWGTPGPWQGSLNPPSSVDWTGSEWSVLLSILTAQPRLRYTSRYTGFRPTLPAPWTRRNHTDTGPLRTHRQISQHLLPPSHQHAPHTCNANLRDPSRPGIKLGSGLRSQSPKAPLTAGTGSPRDSCFCS